MPTPSAQAAEMRLQYWSDAKVARDRGRIAHALNLYAKATALMPVAPEAYYEAATFALEVSGNLAALDDLYDRHRSSFGLSLEEGQPPLMDALCGPGGSEFAIDRLTQANTFPGVPIEWHETLADVLTSRGQLHQALQWRRLAFRRDPMRRANRLAIARLYEALGLMGDAARQYTEVLETWPDDPDAVLALTGIQEQLGQVVDEARLVELFKSAWAEPQTGKYRGDAAEIVAGRVVRVVWAAARRGWDSLATGARQRVRQLVQKLVESHPRHPTTLLAEGYMAWMDGDAAVARRTMLFTSLAIERGAVLQTGSPACDAALRDAVHSARALATDPRARTLPEGPLPAGRAAALERAHAREIWAIDGMLAAMPTYSAWLRLHHVASVPLQYEIHGEYKVLYHDGLFYAVPRRVSEFTIMDGRVYRLKGRARSSSRQLPPRFLALAYWFVSALHRVRQRVALPSIVIRALARLGRLARSGRLRHIAARAAKLSWITYAVKGVIVATTAQELFATIDRHGREQDGRAPRSRRSP